MAKIAPVGRTLTESPDAVGDPQKVEIVSARRRQDLNRRMQHAPPAARDLSYIGLPAESGKARQPKPDCPASLILTGRNPYVEMFGGAKAMFHPDNDARAG